MNFRISSKIISQLQKAGIGIVYLYGSEALKTSDFESDLDFGVVLENPSILSDRNKFSRLYHRVYKIISEILPPDLDREIDLVFLQRASYALQFEAINYGRVLYEISPIFRVNYEEKVLKNYLDLKPILEKFYQATLSRIK